MTDMSECSEDRTNVIFTLESMEIKSKQYFRLKNGSVRFCHLPIKEVQYIHVYISFGSIFICQAVIKRC